MDVIPFCHINRLLTFWIDQLSDWTQSKRTKMLSWNKANRQNCCKKAASMVLLSFQCVGPVGDIMKVLKDCRHHDIASFTKAETINLHPLMPLEIYIQTQTISKSKSITVPAGKRLRWHLQQQQRLESTPEGGLSLLICCSISCGKALFIQAWQTTHGRKIDLLPHVSVLFFWSH